MDRHAETFREEAREILADLESLILELYESPDDPTLIDRVFGAFHTIKGSGAMFGFEAIATFTHEIESVLEHVRQGHVPVSPEMVSLGLSARDKIQQLLDEDSNTLDDEANTIISGFQGLYAEVLPDEGPPPSQELEPGIPTTYRISFIPPSDIFTTGNNPLLLLKELQEMGECTIVAHREKIPSLEELDPEACYVWWDIVLTTEQSEEDVQDVFLFVEDSSEITITPVFEHIGVEECRDYKKLGEILLDRGEISEEELHTFIAGHTRIGEKLVEAGLISREIVASALTEQKHVRKVLQQEKEAISSMRVDAGRIDMLVDLVGELVTVQARLTEKAGDREDTELQIIAESVQRLTEELRDNAMSIRMVPIGTLFSMARRQIHDLAEELGKQVELTTEGSSTELDKSVMDQLSETFVHIIRNAVHHGIETPSIRESLQKPAKGSIHLSAYHEGSTVVIQIRDDGAGIDVEKLKTIAVQKGLISADAQLSKEECLSLVHQPGFSTREEIDNISGRGVGMDVVKRSIDNLRGTVSIDSTMNEGTTITLRLPLTLAIIDGLLVQVGTEKYVFPLAAVDECIEMAPDETERSREKSMMIYRGEAFSFISLRDVLGIAGPLPEKEKTVLVTLGAKKIGFSVDRVVGQHQTVIKSLSKVYDKVEGISGATILGNGTVALILDIEQLVVAKRGESLLAAETATC